MIGYITLGSNNLPDALKFYDGLIEIIGGKMEMQHPSGGRIYSFTATGNPMLGILPPFDGKPATGGNGTMISFLAESRGKIDAIHAKALELGGQDAGAPGVRGEDPDGFYGAYFRDLDGNKLCAYRFGPA